MTAIEHHMKAPPLTLPIRSLVRSIETWNPSRTEGEETFDYVDLSSVDSDTKAITGARSIGCSEAPSRARQLVAAKDVLVSTVRPNLNGVASVPDELDGATASTGFCVLRSNSGKLNDRYLFHWVSSPEFVSSMVKLATGASYPAVSDRIILDSEIPLPHKNGKPDLEEQKRIAAILDKADAIRRKRQQALRLTDDFLRSVFLDMFGDPVTNPKGWDTAPASEVFESFRYGTSAKCSEQQVDEDQLPVLRIPNIAQEKVKWDDLKYGDIPPAELERLRLQAGDILFVRTNGNPDLIGRCAMFQGSRDAVYASYLIRGRIPADSDTRPSFVHTLLCTDRLRAEIRQLATTSAGNYNINTKSLGSLPVLLPPPGLQDDFIQLKEKIAGEQQQLLSFEEEAESLFASLQQRAFRGEL